MLIEIAAGVSDPAHPHRVLESGKAVDLVDACKMRIRTARSAYEADLLAANSEPGLKLRSLDLLFAIEDESMQLAALLRRIEPGDDDELRARLARAIIELDPP